jgi:hypothetical protein
VKCSLLVLSCYLDDELEARKRGELEAHLVACQRCRGGLGHLREEVERIGALARVHVPDHSAHALMEVTGLLGADDPLPPRRSGVATAPRMTGMPPWMAGGEAGAALPWSAPRPTQVRPIPRELPGAEEMDSIPDDSQVAEPAAEITASEPDEVELEGSAAQPHSPQLPVDVVGGVEALPFDVLSLSFHTAPPLPEPAVEAVPEAIADPPEAPVAEQAVLPEAEALVAEQSRLPADDPLDEAQHSLPVDAAATADLPVASSPPATPFADDLSHVPSPPAGDPAVAVWTSENEAPTMSPTSAPAMTAEDDLTSAVDDADVPAGPMAAPRAGVLARIRDHFALRRTLARPAKEVPDDSVEIVSGAGAPMRFGHSRAELARRRSEALRPSVPVGSASAMAEVETQPMTEDEEWTVPSAPSTYVGHVTLEASHREPALHQQLPPPARPSSLAPPPAPPPLAPPAEPQLPLGDALPHGWRPRDENPLTAMPLTPAQPLIQASPSELREGRRLLAIFGAAAVVLFAVGLASARTSSPIPAPTSPTTAQQSRPTVSSPSQSSSSSPSQSQSSQAQPSSPAGSVPPASSQPAAGPQLTSVQVLGSGGTGWQVQSIRYGDHTTYLRAVFDLAASGGAATASPKVTIGFSDPTTVLVAFNGVVPAGGVGSLPSAKFLTGVQQLVPSPIAGAVTYQFKLAHPLTVKPLFYGSPIKLVIDFS